MNKTHSEALSALAPDLLDALQNATEALDNVLLHLGPMMTEGDQKGRAKVVQAARDLIAQAEASSAFEIERIPDMPNLIYVEAARRFNIAIERTEEGLSLRVYPRTGGELWDNPFVVFDVDEAEIERLEQEMTAD